MKSTRVETKPYKNSEQLKSKARETTILGHHAKKYRLITPSESANLELIRDFIGKLAYRAGFNGDHVSKIQLAADEACTNVVHHAYEDIPAGPIDVEIVVNRDKFQITVSDKGVGFDPEKFAQPDMVEYLSKFKKGGLGIHLIHTLMDEVTFKIEPLRKNSVKMIKYVHKPESADKLRQQEIILRETKKRR
ncbi:serine-protein kinase RsbW [bacterium BMS3Bbin03]|nr:serine-protein kinase RsbW [bacterium BMS3Bbin03]